jgi:hypothetical protein
MASKIKVDQIQTADGTGTIALQNQLSGLTNASMPTGSVLQVVTESNSTEQSISTTSWTDTNLSLSITPLATTSKIHIQYIFPSVYLTAANCGCSMRILRDTTSLFTPSAGYAIYNSDGIGYWQYGDIELDSPSTTSSVTYKIQVRNYNSNTVKLSPSSYYKNRIILMEIAG